MQSQTKGSGASVEIESMTLAEPGYVVVHADADGEPGAVIGRTELIDVGTHENVRVQIDPTRAGDRVFPMLHNDDGDGVYDSSVRTLRRRSAARCRSSGCSGSPPARDPPRAQLRPGPARTRD